MCRGGIHAVFDQEWSCAEYQTFQIKSKIFPALTLLGNEQQWPQSVPRIYLH